MSQFRGASSRGSMVRQRGTGNYSNLPPLQNVMVMVDQFVIDQRGKSNPEKDYAEVYLVHSIPELGLTAEFDANGAPLTKVKVVMPMPKAGGEGRRDILGLSQKKAGGPAMGAGSLAIFEKVWYDKKENVLKAHFSRGGPTAEDQANALKNAYPNIYTCVLPERQYKDKDGNLQPSGKQDALFADQEGAALVGTDDELRAAIDNLVAQSAIGTAGFQLHCRELADEALSDEDKVAWASNPETRNSGFIVAKPKLVGEGDAKQWVPLTTDEILEKLWKQSPALAERWGKPGFQFEFVPMMAVGQAQTLVPSSKKNDKGKDNSRIFQLYDADEKGVMGVFDYGWTACHAIVERMAQDSNIWYATYENPVSTRPQMFALPDIPTPNMPGYHLAAVQAEAQRLGENKRAYFQANKSQEQEHGQEEEPAGPAPR